MHIYKFLSSFLIYASFSHSRCVCICMCICFLLLFWSMNLSSFLIYDSIFDSFFFSDLWFFLSLSLSGQNNEGGCDDGFVYVKSAEVSGIAEKGPFYLAGRPGWPLWIFITYRKLVFVAAMAVSLLACLIGDPIWASPPFPAFRSLSCVCIFCFEIQ